MRRALLVCLLFAAIGCEDDLPRASEIEHMRVLGAKTIVVGDEERASPRPGEEAELTWDMAYPQLSQDDSELASLFLTCTAPTQFTGIPVCQEQIDFARMSGRQTGEDMPMLPGVGSIPFDCRETPDMQLAVGPFSVACVTGKPRSRIEIPEGFPSPAKLVIGMICRNGIPTISTDQPTGVVCIPRTTDPNLEVESIPVYGTVKVEQKEADANLNPSIDAAKFLFGETELPWLPVSDEDAETIDEDDCKQAAQDQLVLSTNGKDEQITIEYDAGARERFDGEPEALEFSTYVTYGRLTRRFTVFERDAELPLKSELRWDVKQALRDELGDDSKLVRFWFTLLDRRGGYAVTHRELCIGRDLTGN